MHQKRFVLCSAAAVLALAIACSKSSQSPASPTNTENSSGNAAADGSTLKATAPTPVSPVNGEQPDTLTLITNKAVGKFNASLALSYEFEIKTAAGAVVPECTSTVADDGGGTVSYTPTCPLEFDTAHSWRVRAKNSGDSGPWSASASFKTPSGGYIRDNEVFDPLTNGKTAGEVNGGVQLIGGQGALLVDQGCLLRYRLPVNLQLGEFSMMIVGGDEGAEGV
jgi:hypothetical protein